MKKRYYIKINTFFILIINLFSLLYSAEEKVPYKLENALNTENLVPVLVLGSGPAGLSAALYTARAKLHTIVLTGDKLGGQLANIRQIENWPGKRKASGAETIDDLLEQAQHFGAIVINDSAQSLDISSWPFTVTTANGKKLRVMALIVATGGIPKKLDLPGIEKYWGHGIGVCTICDAPFHKGQIVGVVGGGDTAADRALQLGAFAKKVYMFVRDPEMDASGTVQDYVKNAHNIEVLYNTELVRVDGDNEGLTKAIIRNNKTNEIKEIPLKGLYFAIGYHPNSELVKGLIKTDDQGFVDLMGKTHTTSKPGIFAAGDVTVVGRKYRKAAVATGGGAMAGTDGIGFMQKIGYTPDTAKQFANLLYSPQKNKIQFPSIKDLPALKHIIYNAKVPVIVDFYTGDCPTCRTLLEHLKELAEDMKDAIKVVRVNPEEAPELTEYLKIPSIPYILIFKNGNIIARGENVHTREELHDFMKRTLNLQK